MCEFSLQSFPLHLGTVGVIGGVRIGVKWGLKEPQREASCVFGEGPTEVCAAPFFVRR